MFIVTNNIVIGKSYLVSQSGSEPKTFGSRGTLVVQHGYNHSNIRLGQYDT